VDVKVHYLLAGGLTDVNANVEAGRVKLLLETVLVLDEEVKEGTVLFRRDIEEALDVTPGDDQAVPWCHRVAIVYDVGQSVAGDLQLLIQGKFAKGTLILGHYSLLLTARSSPNLFLLTILPPPYTIA